MKVLITGGSSGLGAAVARKVADEGGRPLIIDRRPPGSTVEHTLADLADRRAAERAVHCLARSAGGLDAVVAAASIDLCGKLPELPAEDCERVIRANLRGTAAVVRAALPFLSGSADGRVVTCACALGSPRSRELGDATADSGVAGFTGALASQVAGRVDVTVIVPPGTEFPDGPTERYEPPHDTRPDDPEHVAAAVLFALHRPRDGEIRALLVSPRAHP